MSNEIQQALEQDRRLAGDFINMIAARIREKGPDFGLTPEGLAELAFAIRNGHHALPSRSAS